MREAMPTLAAADGGVMIDLGLVDAVDAEAIGQPGQRTFRLRARAGATYVALWLEKEQLAALGRSVSQLLAERSMRRGQPGGVVEAVGNFPQRAQVEFQVARMGLDYDVEQEQAVFLADDPQAAERRDTPALRMAFSRSQALTLIHVIEEAVAGGRPTCPLCKQPLDYANAPHECVHTNGHSKEPLPPRESAEADDEDDDESED